MAVTPPLVVEYTSTTAGVSVPSGAMFLLVEALSSGAASTRTGNIQGSTAHGGAGATFAKKLAKLNSWGTVDVVVGAATTPPASNGQDSVANPSSVQVGSGPDAGKIVLQVNGGTSRNAALGSATTDIGSVDFSQTGEDGQTNPATSGSITTFAYGGAAAPWSGTSPTTPSGARKTVTSTSDDPTGVNYGGGGAAARSGAGTLFRGNGAPGFVRLTWYFEVPFPVVSGTYALTGQDVTFRYDRALKVDTGAYGYTGRLAALVRTYRLPVIAGSYGLSGSAVNFKFPIRRIAAEVTSYSLNGQAVDMSRQTRRLPVSAGSYGLAGQAAGLKAARRFAMGVGSIALNGQSAFLRRSQRLAVNAASYALSGQLATLKLARRIALLAMTYNTTGQAVRLNLGKTLFISAGSYALNGQVVAIRKRLDAVGGLYALNGRSISLRAFRYFPAAMGAYSYTGQAANVRRQVLPVSQGSYILTGQNARVIRQRRLPVVQGSYSSVGQQAALRLGRRSRVDTGMYVIVGPPGYAYVGQNFRVYAISYTGP